MKNILLSIISVSILFILIDSCSVAQDPSSSGSLSSSLASSSLASSSLTSSSLASSSLASSSLASSSLESSSPASSSLASSSSSSSQQPNIIYNLNTSPGSMWSVGPINCDWQWGTVTSVGPIGAVCYGTGISGNYANNRTYADNYVQLGPLNLTGFANASGFRMTFQAYFYQETDSDYCQLQYSTDGTTFSAVTAAYVSGYPYTSGNEWSPFGAVSFQEVTVNLGGMGLNGLSTVYFRWVLRSDGSGVYPGFYIDDIDIGY